MLGVNLSRLVFDEYCAISAAGGKTPTIGFATIVKDDIGTTVDQRQGGTVVDEIEVHTLMGTVSVHGAKISIRDNLEAVSTNADGKARWVRGRIRPVAELHDETKLQAVQVQHGCTIKVMRPV